MDLKKKLAETKTKIQKNAPMLSAISGAVAGAAITYITLSRSKTIEQHQQMTTECERLFISEETRQEVLGGSKDVWFDVNGARFDVILHSED